jgi:hypothetical protein
MLLLVPVVLLVLLTLLFTVNYLTRTQYHRGHAYRAGQEALYLAEGGLTLARAWLGSADGKALVARMTSLAVEQLAADGPAVQVELEEELELPGLGVLTAGFPETSVNARIRLTTRRGTALACPVPGLAADPIETAAALELVSECRTKELVRRVRARFPARLVSSLPPLLTRFVLLVCESGAAAKAINCVDYDPETGQFRDAASGARTWPIEVCGAREGLSQSLPPGSDQELECVAAENKTGDANGGPAGERAGWVYLGGPDPWFLQLTFGSGTVNPLEEHGLLRRIAYVLPVSQLGAEFQEKLQLFGFARGIARLAMLGSAGDRWTSPSTGEPVSERTALLHLSGNARMPAPTVVLGPVYRRFLAYSKVRKGNSGPFTSFVHAAGATEYARVAAPFEALTGQGYDAYRRVMARVAEEPYNRSHDYLSTSRGRAHAGPGSRIDPGDTPAVPERLLLARALEPTLVPAAPQPRFLYPAAQAGPSAALPVRILRRGPGGRQPLLFAGDPGKLEHYDDLLRARCTFEAPRTAVFTSKFIRRTANGAELDLGGHAVHLGQSPFVLPAVRVVGGGTLVADGDVVLEGPVQTAPCEVLTIVSLRGSIRLQTPGPIHASLVALRGQLRPAPGGGLELHGALACRNLDNFAEFLQNAGPKRLVYDPRMDPADGETFKRFYRLALTGDEERFLERR